MLLPFLLWLLRLIRGGAIGCYVRIPRAHALQRRRREGAVSSGSSVEESLGGDAHDFPVLPGVGNLAVVQEVVEVHVRLEQVA